MFLFRTICSTDWKCRPTHSLTNITTADNIEELVAAMNKDVRKWMSEDIATQEMSEMEEQGREPLTHNWETKRAEAIETDKMFSDADVMDMWECEDRFEMTLRSTAPGEPAPRHREFVDRMGDGDRTTVAYHFFSA